MYETRVGTEQERILLAINSTVCYTLKMNGNAITVKKKLPARSSLKQGLGIQIVSMLSFFYLA